MFQTNKFNKYEVYSLKSKWSSFSLLLGLDLIPEDVLLLLLFNEGISMSSIYHSPTDFSAAYLSASTLTLSQLSFSGLVGTQILSIKVEKTDNTIVNYTNGVDDISISYSGTTLTMAGATAAFAPTDINYSVTLIGPQKNRDDSLDANKAVIQNPDWANFLDPDELLSVTNAAVNTYFAEINGMRNYTEALIHFQGSTGGSGVVFVIYGTLNKDAAVPSAGGTQSADWGDISQDVFGAANLTLNGGASSMEKVQGKYEKLLIKYTIDNATNQTDVNYRLY